LFMIARTHASSCSRRGDTIVEVPLGVSYGLLLDDGH